MTISLRANSDGTAVILLDGSPKITLDAAGNVIGTKTADYSDNSRKLANTEFVQQHMGSFGGWVRVGANESPTLTLADAGKMFHATLTGNTITLPARDSVPEGTAFHFLYTGTDKLTLATQSGDSIFIGPDGYTVPIGGMQTGDTVTLVAGGGSSGAKGWHSAGGTLHLAHSAKFKTSKAGNGYQMLPSGLIIQWGRVLVPNTKLNVTFPIPFPQEATSVCATCDQDATAAIVSAASISATAFRLIASKPAGIDQSWVCWMAIGY